MGWQSWFYLKKPTYRDCSEDGIRNMRAAIQTGHIEFVRIESTSLGQFNGEFPVENIRRETKAELSNELNSS